MDFEPGYLADLVSDTLERFSEQARQKNVRLDGQVPQGIGPVRMDEKRISRVLSNLIANARRHTAPGGLVQVSVRKTTTDFQVIVQDSGEGIQPADLPFVFEQFYRGEKSRNRSTGGAGLGLAIAKGIIQSHGGRIGIESEVGTGTKVWFTLPAG